MSHDSLTRTTTHEPLPRSMGYIVRVFDEAIVPTQDKLAQYTAVESISVVLSKVLHSMQELRSGIYKMKVDIETHYESGVNNPNMDPRGGWKVYFRILYLAINKLKRVLRTLPDIPLEEGIGQYLSRLYLQNLVSSNLKLVEESFEYSLSSFKKLKYVAYHGHSMTEQELLETAFKSYHHPFWYTYDQNLTFFRDMYNTLKCSVLCSMSIDDALLQKIVMGSSALSAYFSSKTEYNTVYMEKRLLNLKAMKKIWNMAEKGVAKKCIGLFNPRVKSKAVVYLHPQEGEEAFDEVQVLLLSRRKFPFKVPKSNRKSIHKKEIEDEDYFAVDVITHDDHEEAYDEGVVTNMEAPDDSEGEALMENIDVDENSLLLDYDIIKESTFPYKRPPANSYTIYDDPLCVNVIFHIHGGGFISGSPFTHEMYLREWCNYGDAIVISVNYSKSPEVRYPTALNECFYVYKKLVNKELFDLKPMHIILSGDSAGGNLATALALKASMEGVRKPDGLFLAYPALDLSLRATPSRLLFSNDVLLPFYLLKQCLDAYVDKESDSTTDPLISPIVASNELLKELPDNIVIMSAAYDPLLDDSVNFIRRLDKINKPYSHYVIDTPHGFWNFLMLFPKAQRATRYSAYLIQAMFDKLNEKQNFVEME